MACVGHIQHGMWTHPRDRSSDYTSLDHWVRLAQMLEGGLFDGLFLADVLGAYDVYGGNADASLRAGVQIPLLDPMALVPAMAYATTHLGFGVTCTLRTKRRSSSPVAWRPWIISRPAGSGGTSSPATWTAPPAPWVSMRRWSTTTGTTWPTNTSKSSMRCGRVAGRATR
jgi:hypothetical protein